MDFWGIKLPSISRQLQLAFGVAGFIAAIALILAGLGPVWIAADKIPGITAYVELVAGFLLLFVPARIFAHGDMAPESVKIGLNLSVVLLGLILMVWFAVGMTPPAQPQIAAPANAQAQQVAPLVKPAPVKPTNGAAQPQAAKAAAAAAAATKKKQDEQKLQQPLPRYSHIFEPNSAEDRELTILCYLAAALFAALVGYGELISRYKDSPLRLFSTFAASAYLLVNMGAGVMALDLIRIQKILATGDDWWLKQTLLASFGAIAFFRTSLFTVRVAGSDVGIGPSAMLQSLLSASDRMVDRGQAENRALSAEAIVAPLDYRLARAPLPALCLALMQNPDATDVDDMSKKVSSLDARTDMSLDAKMMVLGVYLMRVVGREVLQSSVSALGKLITRSGLPPTGMAADVADLLGGLDFGKVKGQFTALVKAAKPGITDAQLLEAQQQLYALDGRTDLTNEIKMVLLGGYLINNVGIERLKAAIDQLNKASTPITK